MVVMSAGSAVIVRMSSAMVSPPFRLVQPGRLAGLSPNVPALAGTVNFHGGDVGWVCGDRQDVFGHGFSSFPFGSAGQVSWIVAECSGISRYRELSWW